MHVGCVRRERHGFYFHTWFSHEIMGGREGGGWGGEDAAAKTVSET